MGLAELKRGFFASSVELAPGMVGLEDCESPLTHWNTRGVITETYLALHFASTQKAAQAGWLTNVSKPDVKPGPLYAKHGAPHAKPGAAAKLG